MSDMQQNPHEPSVHYWMRLYKHRKFINFQLMLNDEFGEIFDDIEQVRIEHAVFHVTYRRREFQKEQLHAALHWWYDNFVRPIIARFPKKTDSGHTYKTVKDLKGS